MLNFQLFKYIKESQSWNKISTSFPIFTKVLRFVVSIGFLSVICITVYPDIGNNMNILVWCPIQTEGHKRFVIGFISKCFVFSVTFVFSILIYHIVSAK